MKPVAAALAFVFVSVAAAVVFAFVLGGISATGAVLAFVAGAAAAVPAWRGTTAGPRTPLRLGDWVMLGIFALASLRAFLWVIFTTSDEVRVLSPNNLGDMALHLNFIRYLASGVPFWPESPILSGVPLSYPLGADLFNALLEVLRVDTYRGLVWVGLAGAALTAVTLWRWGGPFGLAAFLFNGGLAGFVVLRALVQDHTLQLEDFQSEIVWKNLFLAMFVTQRGLLFALPAGLFLLNEWRSEFFQGTRRAPRWLQVLLYAGTTLFSLHTFLFLSAILAAIFLSTVDWRALPRMLTAPGQPRTLLLFAAVSFLPAVAGVVLATGLLSAPSALHLAPAWINQFKLTGLELSRYPEALRLILPWFWNFGIALPLAVVLAGWLARPGSPAEARCFVWASLAVFAMCCVVALTRWEWDNMKVMMWCWLALAPYLWAHILRPLPLAPRSALCFVLFFSGAVSLAGGLDARHGYELARRSHLDAWRQATADIPATSRFACVADYNHPILLLGRKVACGYDGHLWSHGLDYEKKQAILRACLEGRTDWTVGAPQLGVEWLALRSTDPAEKRATGLGQIHDLRPYLKPNSASQEIPPPPPRSVDLPW